MASAPSSSHAPLGPPNPLAQPFGTTHELWHLLEARRPVPLRFALHLSRRPNAALCPCLQADLPAATGCFTVTRILDPEHRVPYITLSPILHAAGLTLVQGLLRFQLSSSSFDLSLAGLEPWDDLWISLPLARSIATELGLAAPLTAILDTRSAPAWSLDELEQGISHNWRIPQQWVDSASYSTDAITQVAFDRVQLLPRGQQIKTLVSSELRSRIVDDARERREQGGRFWLHQRLVRWSAQVVGVWQDIRMMSGAWEEEERGARMGPMLEDLRDVVLAPTSADVLEWLQLIAPQADDAFIATDPSSPLESTLLAPLTLAELAEQRKRELTLGSLLLSNSQDTDEALVHLDSLIRSKLASLHHMNLLSLPHLSSPQDDPAANVQPLDASHHTPSTSSTAPTVQQTQPTATATGKGIELSQLEAKVDQLTAKLDRLLDTQLSTGPAFSPHSERVLLTRRELGDTTQTPASTEPSPRAVWSADVEPVSPLRSFETSPPLLVVILCAIGAFLAIRSTVN
ncbi:hypothetical protein EX895_003817 [Sporisorium graminicola]|uniref:Uncharacterized protein n=1 Tax=Sporisorium graminicola TaxID=280036 RepID=A0A4U7KRS6_9BASI|nr:hypothetical protein EX895_003817 [Sporisorium graminicola]TKY87140.1 hypothetical protein EX895_003817 [Sporisorium graminicola]